MNDELGLYRLEYSCNGNDVYLVFIEAQQMVKTAIDLKLEFSGRYTFPISRANLITNDKNFITKFKKLGLQRGMHPFQNGEINDTFIEDIKVCGLTPKQAIQKYIKIKNLKTNKNEKSNNRKPI